MGCCVLWRGWKSPHDDANSTREAVWDAHRVRQRPPSVRAGDYGTGLRNFPSAASYRQRPSTMSHALITGASNGIGLELARLFAADGIDVVLCSSPRSRDRLVAIA